MKQLHFAIAGMIFFMCLISVYFGISVYNAQEYFLIDHLNDMDNMNYYDQEDVPKLNFMAATFTVPFVFLAILGELRIIWKAKHKKRRNIAFAALFCASIIFTFCLLTLSDPPSWNFNPWGFVWITMGFFIIVGNLVSSFMTDLSKG